MCQDIFLKKKKKLETSKYQMQNFLLEQVIRAEITKEEKKTEEVKRNN